MHTVTIKPSGLASPSTIHVNHNQKVHFKGTACTLSFKSKLLFGKDRVKCPGTYTVRYASPPKPTKEFEYKVVAKKGPAAHVKGKAPLVRTMRAISPDSSNDIVVP